MHHLLKLVVTGIHHRKPVQPLDAALFILILACTYWADLLVIMWPGRLVVVRGRRGHIDDLGIVGRFAFSIPLCVCVWRDLAPPTRRFRFYWLHQVKVLKVRPHPGYSMSHRIWAPQQVLPPPV